MRTSTRKVPRRSRPADPTAQQELPGGADTGIFLHEMLAAVSLAELAQAPEFADWMARPAVAALLERIRRRHGQARRVNFCHLPRGSCTERTRHALRLGSTVIAGLASAKVALREMEFLFPIPERKRIRCFASQGRQAQSAVEGRARRGQGLRGSSVRARGPRLRVRLEERRPAEFRPTTRWPATVARTTTCRRASTPWRPCACVASTTPANYAQRFGGVVYCFLRGQREQDESAGIHFFKPTWEDILAWETDMLGQQFWGISP
jgi:exodeoxyribonuclease V beta subunit